MQVYRARISIQVADLDRDLEHLVRSDFEADIQFLFPWHLIDYVPMIDQNTLTGPRGDFKVMSWVAMLWPDQTFIHYRSRCKYRAIIRL